MDVSVKDRLARCGAIIQTDIEPIRMQIFVDFSSGFGNQRPQGGLIIGREFVDTCDMRPGDNQGVAFCHGEGIPQDDADFAGQPDTVGVRFAEWALNRHYALGKGGEQQEPPIYLP